MNEQTSGKMTRRIVMGIVMIFALGLAGCRACMAPYDYCQPTFIPERGDQCMGELYRCGSNLGGMNRASAATGDCESCGGGYTEYYGGAGQETVQPVEAAPAAPQTMNPPAPPRQEAAPYYAAASQNANFSLRDDSAEAY